MDQLLQSANAAHAAGRLAEAEQLVSRILSQQPQNAPANLLMGVLAGKTRRDDLALTHLKRVISTDPNSFEALFWLATINRRLKRIGEAVNFAKRAVILRPDNAHGRNNLGLCYLDAVNLDLAIIEFEKALTILPNQAPVLHNLGTALYRVGRDADAAKVFEQALAIAPNSIETYLNLGQVHLSQSNPSEAAKCARKALKLNPNVAEAELLLASALVEESLSTEAEVHMKRAIELNPSDASAHGLLGQRYQTLGKFHEANIHLLKSIELEPTQGFAYFAYAHNNKVTESDRPMVETMLRLSREDGLDPRQRMFIHYGLGRSLEMLGQYKEAMESFDEANALARKLKFGDGQFDRARYAAEFDGLIKKFDRSFFEKINGKGNSSELPILIAGMMRSGTTLAEQILSSHPEVGAAGEQWFWPRARQSVLRTGANSLADLLSRYAKEYVETLKKIAPRFHYVTDKMPANYELLGPIHASLPNARIIHIKRNPIDTCISIYATPNRVPVEFAHDRAAIVFAYQQYQRLMDHWRTILPSDRFLEINYEDLVASKEHETRQMLAFLGLEWDDALNHHELNHRNVTTPSVWQVRQPIYTTSVERWKRFEPWLGEFRTLLPGV